MNRRTRALLAMATLCAVASAAALAWFAFSLTQYRQSFAAKDRYGELVTPDVNAWRPATFLQRMDEKVLALEDDREYRKIVVAYANYNQEQHDVYDARPRSVLMLAMKRFFLSRHSAAAEAAVNDLLGTLAVEEATYQGQIVSDDKEASRFVRQALDAFRQAILLNERNEDAKRHLELLLALIKGDQQPQPSNSGKQDPGDDATAGIPGGGY